jgi:hypothetical protein
MLHFNNLDYCAVPALPQDFKAPTWLKVELGVIAGRLYFDFEEYTTIKTFLGIADSDDNNDEDDVNSDNMALNGSASKLSEANAQNAERKKIRNNLFTCRPISFMVELLAALRKECDIAATPMAYVLSGKPLTANHPFFVARKVENVQKNVLVMRQEAIEQKQEDDAGHVDDLELLMAGEGVQDEEEVADCSEDEEWYKAQAEVEREKENKASDVW